MYNLLLFAAAKVEQRDPSDVSSLPQTDANDGAIDTALTLVFGAFAAIAVVVIIIAAINFITSEGNPEKLAKARKTIIYALVGLMIALGAEAIVLFVIGRLG